jgi:PAS domain S-box-containing protein
MIYPPAIKGVKYPPQNGSVEPTFHPVCIKSSIMESRKERQSAKRGAPRLLGGVAAELNHTQEAAQQPEVTMFRSIAEGMRDALVVVDVEGKIRYWNPACEEILGYASDEMTGKSLEAVIPARYQKQYEMALEDIKEKYDHLPRNRIFESEVIRKDGTEVPIEVSVSRISVRGKWHVVCVVRDITHWRSAQKELIETLSKYHFMCNKHKDAIVLVDVETKRFLEVNDAATNMYGFSKEEFLNLRTVDVFLEEDSSIMVQPKPVSAFHHKRKGGGLFPVEITGCLFSWKRRETYCAIVRDVSGCPSVEEKEGN